MSIAFEQCVMQKGKPATAGSRMLENFIAPFDAAVVEKARAAGFMDAGRAGMDEFALPALPADGPEAVSEAVLAVSQGRADAALCNDLFGKIRRQAPENGVCYIHPTYGTVSRYGLIPSACSMDQIGVVCGSLDTGFAALAAIAGKDGRDGAMLGDASFSYAADARKLRVALPAFGRGAEAQAFAGGFETASLDLAHFDVCPQLMAILAFAEISNNISRYDGLKFGRRTGNYRTLSELYARSRGEGFGLRAKLAALIGTKALCADEYAVMYDKAMRVRRLVKESLAFDAYDVIALPSRADGDPVRALSAYALPQLAGLPSVSFPFGGGGVQLIAKAGGECDLYSAWKQVVS